MSHLQLSVVIFRQATDAKNIEELLEAKAATGQKNNALEYMQENLMSCIEK